MAKQGKLVSPELSRVLDHLTGLPQGKEEAALAIEASAKKLKGSGPADSFGIWFGACYYVRDKNGNVQGRHGTDRLAMCVA